MSLPDRSAIRAPAQAIRILRDGPQFLQDLLKQVGAYSPVQIDMDDLINQGIIDRAGLTPTDLLHVSGEYTPWDPDSAWVMTRAAANIWSESPAEFRPAHQAVDHRPAGGRDHPIPDG